ncbi:MAG: flippase-like domain-containing protein [Pseudobutyrivibrio sp.]|nr:flippase-like domain-containing protein [Pseudobutyrivibrio sp.]
MNKNVVKKIFWMCFTFLLSVLTIWTLLKQNESMSLQRLLELISNADKKWLTAAIISTACYVLFEALAICTILKGLDHVGHFKKGLIYSTSDVYFSAITPSSTGGQPASAFFMIKDGISAGVTSATLLINLMMYNISIVILGIIAIIMAPKSFFEFHLAAKIFILVGFVGLTMLSVIILSVLKDGNKIFVLVRRFINFLYSKKLIHRLEHKLERIDKIEADYTNCAQMIAGKTSILMKALFWNIIQRASQIIVPTFVFVALGGSEKLSSLLFSKQCLITIGYNYVPIPGSLGIADYLMIDGFSSIMSKDAAFELDMLSRGLTFYICVTLSGIITLIGYLKGRKNK